MLPLKAGADTYHFVHAMTIPTGLFHNLLRCSPLLQFTFITGLYIYALNYFKWKTLKR